MLDIKLEGTTLVTLAYNAVRNPLGGLERFADLILPHVPHARFVDTGSTDCTSEVLEKLRATYPHLVVIRKEFDGFASARNHGMEGVSTRYVLILDTDERISPEGLMMLCAYMAEDPQPAYNFEFVDIFPDREARRSINHNPRLFQITGHPRYEGDVYEELRFDGRAMMGFGIPIPITIFHYRPPIEVLRRKDELYVRLLGGKKAGTTLFADFQKTLESLPELREHDPRTEMKYNRFALKPHL